MFKKAKEESSTRLDLSKAQVNKVLLTLFHQNVVFKAVK